MEPETDRVYTKAERIAFLLYKKWLKGAPSLDDRLELQDLYSRSDEPTVNEGHELAQQMRERDSKPTLFANATSFAA